MAPSLRTVRRRGTIRQVLPGIPELWGDNLFTDAKAKKRRSTERELTTPLLLLRCVEVGISIAALDLLTIGLILGMLIEKGDDAEKYDHTAKQNDFDRF